MATAVRRLLKLSEYASSTVDGYELSIREAGDYGHAQPADRKSDLSPLRFRSLELFPPTARDTSAFTRRTRSCDSGFSEPCQFLLRRCRQRRELAYLITTLSRAVHDLDRDDVCVVAVQDAMESRVWVNR